MTTSNDLPGFRGHRGHQGQLPSPPFLRQRWVQAASPLRLAPLPSRPPGAPEIAEDCSKGNIKLGYGCNAHGATDLVSRLMFSALVVAGFEP